MSRKKSPFEAIKHFVEDHSILKTLLIAWRWVTLPDKNADDIKHHRYPEGLHPLLFFAGCVAIFLFLRPLTEFKKQVTWAEAVAYLAHSPKTEHHFAFFWANMQIPEQDLHDFWKDERFSPGSSHASQLILNKVNSLDAIDVAVFAAHIEPDIAAAQVLTFAEKKPEGYLLTPEHVGSGIDKYADWNKKAYESAVAIVNAARRIENINHYGNLVWPFVSPAMLFVGALAAHRIFGNRHLSIRTTWEILLHEIAILILLVAMIAVIKHQLSEGHAILSAMFSVVAVLVLTLWFARCYHAMHLTHGTTVVRFGLGLTVFLATSGVAIWCFAVILIKSIDRIT